MAYLTLEVDENLLADTAYSALSTAAQSVFWGFMSCAPTTGMSRPDFEFCIGRKCGLQLDNLIAAGMLFEHGGVLQSTCRLARRKVSTGRSARSRVKQREAKKSALPAPTAAQARVLVQAPAAPAPRASAPRAPAPKVSAPHQRDLAADEVAAIRARLPAGFVPAPPQEEPALAPTPSPYPSRTGLVYVAPVGDGWDDEEDQAQDQPAPQTEANHPPIDQPAPALLVSPLLSTVRAATPEDFEDWGDETADDLWHGSTPSHGRESANLPPELIVAEEFDQRFIGESLAPAEREPKKAKAAKSPKAGFAAEQEAVRAKMIEDGLSEPLADKLLALRVNKKKPHNLDTWEFTVGVAKKIGWSLDEAISTQIGCDWVGILPKYFKDMDRPSDPFSTMEKDPVTGIPLGYHKTKFGQIVKRQAFVC